MINFRDNVSCVAERLITNEDLVVLYCSGADGILAASYKYGAQGHLIVDRRRVSM